MRSMRTIGETGGCAGCAERDREIERLADLAERQAAALAAVRRPASEPDPERGEAVRKARRAAVANGYTEAELDAAVRIYGKARALEIYERLARGPAATQRMRKAHSDAFEPMNLGRPE